MYLREVSLPSPVASRHPLPEERARSTRLVDFVPISDKCPNGVKSSRPVLTHTDDCSGVIGCLRSARLENALKFEGQSFRGNVEPDNLATQTRSIFPFGSVIEHLSTCLTQTAWDTTVLLSCTAF